MTVFGDYSKYYDLLYSTKDYAQEVDFVDGWVKQYGGAYQSVFELGSGTGKHAWYLAKKGYQVEGVDQSAVMLEIAGHFLSKQEPALRERICLHQADIRTVKLSKQYDVAMALFHVMSYQTTNHDVAAVWETVKAHVKPGGIFIFDAWYGPAALTQLPEVRHKRLEGEAGMVERIAVPTLHENENVIDVNYHLFVQEKGKDNFYKIEEQHRMRYFFLPEIQAWCEQFNMTLMHAGEWLTGKPLGKDTWGACFVVKV